MQDSQAQKIFGELRSRFTRPASRETFLQIIGYSLHLWERDGERSEQNLSAYILDSLLRWQERLPPSHNARVNDHTRPRDEPLALHGSLLERAVFANCGWLPALRAIDLCACDLKGLLTAPDALSSIAPAHITCPPGPSSHTTYTCQLFQALDLSRLESLSIPFKGDDSCAEFLDAFLETTHALLEDLDIEYNLSPALFREICRATSLPALKRLRLGIDANAFKQNEPMNFIAHRALVGLHISFNNARGHDLPGIFGASQFPALEHLSLESAALYRPEHTDAFGDASARFPALRSLRLAHCFLGNFFDEPELLRVTALLDERILARIEHLELINCNLCDAELITLIESGQLTHVNHLELHYNHLTDASLSLLLDPKHLPALTAVNLSGTDCSPDMSRKIRARFAEVADTSSS